MAAPVVVAHGAARSRDPELADRIRVAHGDHPEVSGALARILEEQWCLDQLQHSLELSQTQALELQQLLNAAVEQKTRMEERMGESLEAARREVSQLQGREGEVRAALSHLAERHGLPTAVRSDESACMDLLQALDRIPVSSSSERDAQHRFVQEKLAQLAEALDTKWVASHTVEGDALVDHVVEGVTRCTAAVGQLQAAKSAVYNAEYQGALERSGYLSIELTVAQEQLKYVKGKAAELLDKVQSAYAERGGAATESDQQLVATVRQWYDSFLLGPANRDGAPPVGREPAAPGAQFHDAGQQRGSPRGEPAAGARGTSPSGRGTSPSPAEPEPDAPAGS